MVYLQNSYVYFFFNDTATTEIYTLSLHDALPIFRDTPLASTSLGPTRSRVMKVEAIPARPLSRNSTSDRRSEEHTSELQSRQYLVCRLLLEKKKKNTKTRRRSTQLLSRVHTSNLY